MESEKSLEYLRYKISKIEDNVILVDGYRKSLTTNETRSIESFR